MQIVNYGNIKEMLIFPDESEYITNEIKKLGQNSLMVEWGTGGSSFLWLEKLRDDQKLITIEHHKGWYDTVSQSMIQHFGKFPSHKFQFIHTEVEEGFAYYYGLPSEENTVGLKKYICPTELIYNADLYFIDGIARGACLASVLLKRKKKDSIIFIHDYAPRPTWYNWITQFCQVEIVGQTLAKVTYN